MEKITARELLLLIIGLNDKPGPPITKESASRGMGGQCRIHKIAAITSKDPVVGPQIEEMDFEMD